MANTFKKVIDRQVWAQVAPSIDAHAAARSLASDLRNDSSRNPFVYHLSSNSLFARFNIVTKAWQNISGTPLTAGTFGAGSTSAFAPSLGAVGTRLALLCVARGSRSELYRLDLGTAAIEPLGVIALGEPVIAIAVVPARGRALDPATGRP